MKIIRVVFIALLAVNLIGCKPSIKEKQTTETQEIDLPAKLLTVSLDIKGMTCEIGCAKTIESKISKLEGVTESKVNFEEKKGIFVFDANKTSKEKIISTINNLIDGKMYSATDSKERAVCSKECAEKCKHKEDQKCIKACAEKCEEAKKETK
ncbi:copper chaperone CopZ [Wenyingzhuangia heitensis]|uniref:Copper chaperone CopZ n=1 Tax=Wenyingzhuangia heitensis TaxID=1487859 RepID=A0ABX0U8N5_9FLAO|nr:heavy metal-associated domain-containing protein [Wenyingzhuangia heitensis]NIJ43971.1 copper chaperone CopZ [Wenyingzhuangia heitensis]